MKKKAIKKQKKLKPKKKKASPKAKSEVVLVAGCKIWDRATTKAFDGDYKMPSEIARFGKALYSSGDYGALQCRVDGKRAEVTVGSSTGHRAHIDLEKKTVDYYDFTYDRKKVMLVLFKEAKLKCVLRNGGIHCDGLTPAKVKTLYEVLVMPTSMDYRLSSCKSANDFDQCRSAELKYFRN